MRLQRRGGATGNTGDFRGFSEEQRRQVLSAASLAATEIPVVLSFRDDHSWTLLTTERVMWKNGLSVEGLKGSDIETIVSPVTPTDPRRVPLSPSGLPLAIRLGTNRGQTVDLPVEPDKTAYGAMHYLLTFIIETSRMKQAAPGKK